MTNKLAILFPGGGTQYVGMGKYLYSKSEIARNAWSEANDTMGCSLSELCFSGSAEDLAKMNYSQPAILVSSVAAFRVFEQQINIDPDFLAGHSLGEYSALVCAGVLSLPDAIKLVQRRGEILQAAGEKYNAGMMSVSKIPSGVVENKCETLRDEGFPIYVSVYNSDLQCVVSGSRAAFHRLKEELKDEGGELKELEINTPSHCLLLRDYCDSFRNELLKYDYGSFRYPIVSDGTIYVKMSKKDIVDRLLKQMTEPVHWIKTITTLLTKGVSAVIDIGPQGVLYNLNGFITDLMDTYAMDTNDGIGKIKADMLGDTLGFVKGAIKHVVTTPNINYKRYNEGKVLEAYKRLQLLKESAVNEMLPANALSEVIELTRLVLNEKGISNKIQTQKINLLQELLILKHNQSVLK